MDMHFMHYHAQGYLQCYSIYSTCRCKFCKKNRLVKRLVNLGYRVISKTFLINLRSVDILKWNLKQNFTFVLRDRPEYVIYNTMYHMYVHTGWWYGSKEGKEMKDKPETNLRYNRFRIQKLVVKCNLYRRID